MFGKCVRRGSWMVAGLVMLVGLASVTPAEAGYGYSNSYSYSNRGYGYSQSYSYGSGHGRSYSSYNYRPSYQRSYRHCR